MAQEMSQPRANSIRHETLGVPIWEVETAPPLLVGTWTSSNQIPKFRAAALVDFLFGPRVLAFVPHAA